VKKIKLSLFVKVLIAIAMGALLGLAAPDILVRIFKTFNVLFAQILKFIVPLLVLGLVTPAIASLGKGAGKMLLVVVGIAYLSTVCAGLFSYLGGNLLFPHYLTPGELSTDAVAAKVYEPYIDMKIPPLCDILTALLLSFMVGLGCIYTGSSALRRGCDEFGEVVKLTMEKVIIPGLPIYIFTMICEMSAKGVIGVVLGSGAKIIVTGMALTILFLIVQYAVAGAIARKNPFKCLWNMLPAYLTGFSICSSSAVIPVTTQCTLKNGVSEDIANFTIPLCSNVHMCGSTIKLAATAVAVAYITGTPIPLTLYLNFVLMQAIATVASPGVMGGVLMASVGLLETILGFTPEQTALLMTIYLALDGYGPACNVTGDGAIAIIIDSLFGKKKTINA
jgi:Na+/H+-dicarboxylate symporter